MNKKDFRVERFRSGGNGGQNVNKVETAVRITHIPTGLKAQSQGERSQSKNHDQAMKVLLDRIEQHEATQKRLDKARARAEIHQGRVRTYNLISNQVTDVVRGIKITGAKQVLDGDLDRVL